MSSFAVPLRLSIRFRLSLVIAGVIFAAVMATAIAGGMRELRRSADARAEMLEAAASAYSAALAQPLLDRDRNAAFEHMRGMRDNRTVIYMALKDADGTIVAQLGAGASVRGKTADLRKLAGLDLLKLDRGSISKDVMSGGEKIGSLTLLADITDLREDLAATLLWTAVVALIAIIGGVSMAQFSIARVTRPIRELATAMSDVGAKQDFSRRVAPSKRRDETGVLGEAFNGMIDNIRERDMALAKHLETLEQTVEDRTHDLRLAKEDAEAANAAKSDFLATMSHEIRTPMNGMMVMAEMLAAADLSTRHRRYAEIITRSGASLLTIINDILDLSKIEAGKLDLEAVPFSPEAMIEDVASLFWEKARSKNLELAVHIAPDVPSQVIGDPTRVNQVVTNLVNNALKFTEKGGVVIQLSVESRDDRARLRIAVIDTGIGIEQSRIATIFEAFSQADQSTTRKFGGTGLGLTVCKRLADAMGGEIVVTSAPGKGSTFAVLVELPVEQAAPAKPVMTGAAVALALPSPLLAKCIARALKDIGCEPRLIASPKDANAGEIVLTQSDLLAKQGGVAGAFNICLTDVGDNRVDALIRDGVAVDLLPLPLGRLALWDFAARALKSEFRGVVALAASTAAVQTETFGHLSILAVDDNAVNREVLREALLSLGVEADFVSNGVEAVEAAKAKAYDIVFMDGSMPEMDGFTATKLIRDHEGVTGARRTYVVALTAQVRGADAEAWAAAGADRHMTKPFTSARLMEALKTAGPGTARPIAIVAAEPQAPAEAALIDDEAVGGMEAVSARSGRDVVAKVWKLFLVQIPDAVAKLEVLAAASDFAGLSKQAHFLKSMSLSSGAARLAALCETIEHDAKAGRADVVGQAVRVRALADATSAEMSARLAVRPAAAAR
jgi:two-component system, NarL family, sensor histidine kinase BarA